MPVSSSHIKLPDNLLKLWDFVLYSEIQPLLRKISHFHNENDGTFQFSRKVDQNRVGSITTVIECN